MTLLEIFILIAALIIMLVGLIGVVLPVLPGVPLIFGGAALYGILTGFKEISFHMLLIFAGLTLFSLIIDFFANYFGVKKMGGGTAGAIGAIIGLIVGIFIGVIWIIILPFLFAVALELIAGKKGFQALKAGTGALLGLLFGGLMRFVIGCVMIGIFISSVLF